MKLEIRDNGVEISGYVNVALRDSRRLPSDRGIFVEQIEPKVFQRALERNDDVKLLFNHKEDRMLGSQKQGNVTLYEDAIGLYAKTFVTDPEVVEKARNNELRGWSFGFIKNKDEWDTTAEPQRRYIQDLDLLEVSILSVTPAYTAMSIESRGDEMVICEQRFDVFEESNVIAETITSTVITETVKAVDGERIIETVRESETESLDHSYYEKTIEVLKLKGGY